VVVWQIPVSWDVTVMWLGQQFPVFCKNVMPSSARVQGSKKKIKCEKQVGMYTMAQLLKIRTMGGACCVFWDPKKGRNRYVSKSKTQTGDRHGE